MAPTQQTTTYPWDNPANYKPCKKKQYEIWVCKPPQGTVVINKLEQADAVKYADGRTFFTASEIKADPKTAAGVQQLLQAGKAYLVKDNQTFVLCGTQGEMWCISGAKLAQKYVWASDGAPLNDDTLRPRLKGDYLPWTKVRTIPDNSTAFACFVPANVQGQIQTSWAILNINGVGAAHGKGDFVIAANVNGQPDLGSRYVVNGTVFTDTYDNRGWADKLVQGQNTIVSTTNSLPDLLPPAEPEATNKGAVKAQKLSISKERLTQLYDNMIEYILEYSDDVELEELGITPDTCTPRAFHACLDYIADIIAGEEEDEYDEDEEAVEGRAFYKSVLGFTEKELDLFGL